MTSLPSEVSYGEACRATFMRLTAEIAAIDLNLPTMRKANARRRADLLAKVDRELDAYNAWLALGGVPYVVSLEQGD